MNIKKAFKPRARLMAQLGEQLIKNENIALLELVKNSYDAYATDVKVTMMDIDVPQKGVIIIEDNGIGMSANIIQSHWMEPGTDHKKKIFDEMVKYKKIGKFDRVPMGEKGIGRFGVHKLGHKITLISRAESAKEVYLEIDWRAFNKEDYLEDVLIELVEREPVEFVNGRTGTKIIISDLKTIWTRGKLREIHRALFCLNSPFESVGSFNVKFDTNKEEWLEGLIELKDIMEYALFEADIKISGNKIVKYDYNFKPWPILKKLSSRRNQRENIDMVKEEIIIERNGRRKKQFPIDLSIYEIGEVDIKLLIFDLESSILSLGVTDKKALKDYLKANGGINVYRDRIRIYEYGESGNDWLQLGLRRINAPTTTLSSNIVIGAVNIKRKSSQDLEEKTNREGFVENDAFFAFRDAVTFAIEKVQNDRQIDKDLLRKLYGPVTKSEPVISIIEDLRIKVNKKVQDKELQEEINGCLDNIETDYKYISEVYLRSATSGLSLSIVIHEIQKIISELEHAVKEEHASKHVRALISDLSRVTDGYASVIRSKKKTTSDMKDILEKAIFNVKYRLKVHKIDVVEEYSSYSSNTSIECAENLILGTIINIIDNSIWWMTYFKIEHKKLYFSISDDLPGYKSIIIADNGRGFTLPTDKIVKPFISDKPGGMGLGLHLAYEIMNAHGGELIFPAKGDVEIPDDFKNGAIIALAFKGDKR